MKNLINLDPWNIIDQILFLFKWVFYNVSLYFITHIGLSYFNNYYNKLNYDLKCYTVKNLTKSAILAAIIYWSWDVMIPFLFVHKIWDNRYLTYMGHIYASTDITALIIVPNLSDATIVHHWSVVIFNIFNMYLNYEVPGIHRNLVLLTYFSALPYVVNTRLGLRHLVIDNRQKYIITVIAFVIYSISIILNFIFQVYGFIYDAIWVDLWIPINLLYLLLYKNILSDDYVLLKYLYHKIIEYKQLRYRTSIF